MHSPLVLRRLARDPWALCGAALLGLVVIGALGSAWWTPGDPFQGNLSESLRAPSSSHVLGTDQQGRDLFARVLYGARLSLSVGLVSQGIALVLGLTLGLAAGYRGRWIDAAVMRLADITLAFPPLLLLVAVAAAVRPSLPVVLVVIGVVGWAGMARITRGQVLVVRSLDYVHAARALGASDRRIVLGHVLPNVLGPVAVAATLGVGAAIMAEAALSFVGLGAQPPIPSWGAMVAEGRDLLRTAPWVSLFPGLAIGVVVLGVNLLGDGLQDALDPRALRARIT